VLLVENHQGSVGRKHCSTRTEVDPIGASQFASLQKAAPISAVIKIRPTNSTEEARPEKLLSRQTESCTVDSRKKIMLHQIEKSVAETQLSSRQTEWSAVDIPYHSVITDRAGSGKLAAVSPDGEIRCRSFRIIQLHSTEQCEAESQLSSLQTKSCAVDSRLHFT
jgi:hypothetical protein